MYRGRNVPEIITRMVGGKLDLPIVGQCEVSEQGRICTATYSVFHLDIEGIPQPFTVTRDHFCFIVLHRGQQTKGETLEEAVNRAVSVWEELCAVG